MHSPADDAPEANPPFERPLGNGIKRWNRKLHYYIGLFLLLFVWLFALSGLLLNHSQWKFAEFWENRHQTQMEREIVPPPPGADLVQARDIMGQLGIQGELEWTTTRNDTNRFDFRASRPGKIYEVKVDLARNRAAVQQIEFNAWGVMRVLHSFTGVRLDDSRNKRDWYLTSVWALTMDAVAVGLILMVLGSLLMWWELPTRRKSGAIVLLLGTVSCGLFCLGLRWLF